MSTNCQPCSLARSIEAGFTVAPLSMNEPTLVPSTNPGFESPAMAAVWTNENVQMSIASLRLFMGFSQTKFPVPSYSMGGFDYLRSPSRWCGSREGGKDWRKAPGGHRWASAKRQGRKIFRRKIFLARKQEKIEILSRAASCGGSPGRRVRTWISVRHVKPQGRKIFCQKIFLGWNQENGQHGRGASPRRRT